MSAENGAVKTARWSIEPLDCSKLPSDVEAWAAAVSKKIGGPAWLLAFTLQGTAWGRLEADGLHLAADLYPGQVLDLAASSLQEVYVFSQAGQGHAWLAGQNWRGALLLDDSPPGVQPVQGECFDQDLLLWGSRLDDWKENFALLREGAQGMLQAVPLASKLNLRANRDGTPALRVRSYLLPDAKTDAAYIAATRFVEIVQS
jgi:CRISPR-associated protein (TIGR03984 family)